MLPWEITHRSDAMKAAVYGSQGLEIRELAKPQVKPGQLLVRVRYAGLNRRELTRMKGDEGKVPGLEFAGEVAELDADVKGFKAGDRVMAMGGASYAEYAVADPGQTLPLPRGVSLEQAATLPVALMTMHDAVVTNGNLRPGEAVLVQGASSGVGLMALQIDKVKGAAVV